MSEPTKTEEIRVDVYGKPAPDAAKFGVGATTLAEIEQANKGRLTSGPATITKSNSFIKERGSAKWRVRNRASAARVVDGWRIDSQHHGV